MKLLDTVMLLEDKPEKNLSRDAISTIVEVLAEDVFEVEFADDDGKMLALVALPAAALEVVDAELVEDLLELRRAEEEDDDETVSLEDVKKQFGIG